MMIKRDKSPIFIGEYVSKSLIGFTVFLLISLVSIYFISFVGFTLSGLLLYSIGFGFSSIGFWFQVNENGSINFNVKKLLVNKFKKIEIFGWIGLIILGLSEGFYHNDNSYGFGALPIGVIAFSYTLDLYLFHRKGNNLNSHKYTEWDTLDIEIAIHELENNEHRSNNILLKKLKEEFATRK